MNGFRLRSTSAVKNGGLVEAALAHLPTTAVDMTSAVKNGGLVEAPRLWRGRCPVSTTTSAVKNGGLVEARVEHSLRVYRKETSAVKNGGLVEAREGDPARSLLWIDLRREERRPR